MCLAASEYVDQSLLVCAHRTATGSGKLSCYSFCLSEGYDHYHHQQHANDGGQLQPEVAFPPSAGPSPSTVSTQASSPTGCHVATVVGRSREKPDGATGMSASAMLRLRTEAEELLPAPPLCLLSNERQNSLYVISGRTAKRSYFPSYSSSSASGWGAVGFSPMSASPNSRRCQGRCEPPSFVFQGESIAPARRSNTTAVAAPTRIAKGSQSSEQSPSSSLRVRVSTRFATGSNARGDLSSRGLGAPQTQIKSATIDDETGERGERGVPEFPRGKAATTTMSRGKPEQGGEASKETRQQPDGAGKAGAAATGIITAGSRRNPPPFPSDSSDSLLLCSSSAAGDRIVSASESRVRRVAELPATVEGVAQARRRHQQQQQQPPRAVTQGVGRAAGKGGRNAPEGKGGGGGGGGIGRGRERGGSEGGAAVVGSGASGGGVVLGGGAGVETETGGVEQAFAAGHMELRSSLAATMASRLSRPPSLAVVPEEAGTMSSTSGKPEAQVMRMGAQVAASGRAHVPPISLSGLLGGGGVTTAAGRRRCNTAALFVSPTTSMRRTRVALLPSGLGGFPSSPGRMVLVRQTSNHDKHAAGIRIASASLESKRSACAMGSDAAGGAVPAGTANGETSSTARAGNDDVAKPTPPQGEKRRFLRLHAGNNFAGIYLPEVEDEDEEEDEEEEGEEDEEGEDEDGEE
eukprot:GHVU01031423.1.p1 GENE.GHVU01031423.1~~GHVU01031423.1.p1  ORF type:complete len:692 (+),score=107.31 GHVU01031423.1:1-2076(+)